ncbi:hypothetical protein CA830_39600, partial [Burkholderia multivorans]
PGRCERHAAAPLAHATARKDRGARARRTKARPCLTTPGKIAGCHSFGCPPNSRVQFPLSAGPRIPVQDGCGRRSPPHAARARR